MAGGKLRNGLDEGKWKEGDEGMKWDEGDGRWQI